MCDNGYNYHMPQSCVDGIPLPSCPHLGADHGSALSNAPEGLAEVAAPADKGDLEVVLVDVMDLVSRGQDLNE